MATSETHPVPIREEVRIAAEEYRDGLSEKDAMKSNAMVREAAEKTWGMVVHAVDLYLARQGQPIEGGPGAFNERADKLELLRGETTADKFRAIASKLHGECFYGGKCRNIPVRMEEACQFAGDLLEEKTLCSAMSSLSRIQRQRVT